MELKRKYSKIKVYKLLDAISNKNNIINPFSHIFMGFTSDGKYLISYKVEKQAFYDLESESFDRENPFFILHFWNFELNNGLTLFNTFSLFNKETLSENSMICIQNAKNQCDPNVFINDIRNINIYSGNLDHTSPDRCYKHNFTQICSGGKVYRDGETYKYPYFCLHFKHEQINPNSSFYKTHYYRPYCNYTILHLIDTILAVKCHITLHSETLTIIRNNLRHRTYLKEDSEYYLFYHEESSIENANAKQNSSFVHHYIEHNVTTTGGHPLQQYPYSREPYNLFLPKSPVLKCTYKQLDLESFLSHFTTTIFDPTHYEDGKIIIFQQYKDTSFADNKNDNLNINSKYQLYLQSLCTESTTFIDHTKRYKIDGKTFFKFSHSRNSDLLYTHHHHHHQDYLVHNASLFDYNAQIINTNGIVLPEHDRYVVLDVEIVFKITYTILGQSIPNTTINSIAQTLSDIKQQQQPYNKSNNTHTDCYDFIDEQPANVRNETNKNEIGNLRESDSKVIENVKRHIYHSFLSDKELNVLDVGYFTTNICLCWDLVTHQIFYMSSQQVKNIPKTLQKFGETNTEKMEKLINANDIPSLSTPITLYFNHLTINKIWVPLHKEMLNLKEKWSSANSRFALENFHILHNLALLRGKSLNRIEHPSGIYSLVL